MANGRFAPVAKTLDKASAEVARLINADSQQESAQCLLEIRE